MDGEDCGDVGLVLFIVEGGLFVCVVEDLVYFFVFEDGEVVGWFVVLVGEVNVKDVFGGEDVVRGFEDEILELVVGIGFFDGVVGVLVVGDGEVVGGEVGEVVRFVWVDGVVFV